MSKDHPTWDAVNALHLKNFPTWGAALERKRLKSSNWSVPKRDEVALGIVGIQVSKKYGKELQRLFKNQMFKPMKHNISSYNKRMINI